MTKSNKTFKEKLLDWLYPDCQFYTVSKCLTTSRGTFFLACYHNYGDRVGWTFANYLSAKEYGKSLFEDDYDFKEALELAETNRPCSKFLYYSITVCEEDIEGL